MYKAEHGDCNVPAEFPQLGKWVRRQRGLKKKHDQGQQGGGPAFITAERLAKLDGEGFSWALRAATASSQPKAKKAKHTPVPSSPGSSPFFRPHRRGSAAAASEPAAAAASQEADMAATRRLQLELRSRPVGSLARSQSLALVADAGRGRRRHRTGGATKKTATKPLLLTSSLLEFES